MMYVCHTEKRKYTYISKNILWRIIKSMADKKTSEAQKKAYKAYNSKSIQLAVNYRPTDIKEGQRIKAYLEQSGQSANSYIKELIKQDLDSKGIPYPDNSNAAEKDNNDNIDTNSID